MLRPTVIQDPVKRQQVEQVREQVLQANIEAQEKALEILGESQKTAQGVIGKAMEITGTVTQTDPQEIINTTVNNITNEVKSLPQEQVKKIKVQICKEILED